MAAYARDLRPIGEHYHPARRAVRTCIAAVGEFQWAHPLDEAIRLVLVRLPTQIVIKRAADALSERCVDFAAHGQALRRVLNLVRGGDDVQPDHKGLKLGDQLVGELENNNAGLYLGDYLPNSLLPLCSVVLLAMTSGDHSGTARVKGADTRRACAIVTLRADGRQW